MAGMITALKAQKSAKDRINVYLDGEFAFGLALIHALWLRVGQRLTDEDIQTLQQADTLEKARQRAVDLIVYRPRSEKEVRQRLRRAQVDETAIDDVVSNLKTAGLLDDQTFSQAWVDSRQRAGSRSKRMIAWELRQKGVDQATIEASVQGLDDEDAACRAARLRWPKLAGVQPASARRRKLGEYLARHGFDYDTIRATVAHIEQEAQAESDEHPAPSE